MKLLTVENRAKAAATRDALEASAVVDDPKADASQEIVYPELVTQGILKVYRRIAGLPSLVPSDAVNALFSRLVSLCIRPCNANFDIQAIPPSLQDVRSHLILLCAQAEGLLEAHYSTLLGAFPQPLSCLSLFPYYSNYLKLALLEFQLLAQCCPGLPSKLAFVGSGPLPITSIVLALHHLPFTTIDNFDLDPNANCLALGLVRDDPDLRHRMTFNTCDINSVTAMLADYDVVFLAALVGLDKATKTGIIEHLARYMKPGATLVARSAHGFRAFLYPIVEPEMLEAPGFEVVSVFHPTDEVVNSIIIARLRSRDAVEEEEEEEGIECDREEDVNVGPEG